MTKPVIPQYAALVAGLLIIWAATPVLGDTLRVGEVSIVVTDIYGHEELTTSNGLIRFVRGTMNSVHTHTRHGIIRRELLFKPGEPLDPDRLLETERNLRGLGYLTNVSIVPTDTLSGGLVPLEVRVQETWSLTTRASYSRSSNGDRWSAAGSDKNFLGYGVQLEAGLGEDEDRSFRNLAFANRRLLGSTFSLRATYADLSDGYAKTVLLTRPFYQDDGAWSLYAAGWDRSSKPRYYLRDDGSTDRLFANLPLRLDGFALSVSRRLSPTGRGRIWRLGLGVLSEVRVYNLPDTVTLSDGRSVDASLITELDGNAMARENGRMFQPVIVLETRGRSWAAERFVMRYGPVEDLFLDPWLWLMAGPTPLGLGNDRERFRVEMRLRDWSRLGGGFLYADLRGEGSAGSARNRYVSLDGTLGWFVRTGHDDVSRVTVESAYGSNLEGTDAFVLGLTRGLRTLEYDGQVGDRLVRWNVEHAHILPGELLGFYRVGLAAFYAGGAAWWDGEVSGLDDPRHDVGLGLRFGPTRSADTDLARLDLSWSLDGGGPKLTAVTSGLF